MQDPVIKVGEVVSTLHHAHSNCFSHNLHEEVIKMDVLPNPEVENTIIN